MIRGHLRVNGGPSPFLRILHYPRDHLSALLPQKLGPFIPVSNPGLDLNNSEHVRDTDSHQTSTDACGHFVIPERRLDEFIAKGPLAPHIRQTDDQSPQEIQKGLMYEPLVVS